ncbi:uncharacterized protein LOC119641278 isoform X2 [Glossina fuscipes]|uniref:Uncharacterized protein LOC119641278 isoform X2 n=1 Tax=Glossina fuscipes TaxID=7396 RepID=A0A9C6DXZ6_9MUSC|nr:uncharacterized protein LOC119641278 isoform X2 [Glossina fuscipes]KAI9577770.1 hypothetical protein GQX74_010957 [Glossina fuscipes]
MRELGVSIAFKVMQLIICVAALIYKKLTDNKARMIFLRNRKTSNEWNLLQNVTWSQEGSDFSIFAYAGYTYIIAVCLLARLMNLHKKASTTDILLMRFGVIIFLLQGILVFYSVEYVPDEIRLNALILGSLSFLTCGLFLLEDCLTEKETSIEHKFIQTDKPFKKIISSIPVERRDDDNIIHTYV